MGPFPLVIARKHPDARIYAIELNPTAFEYMRYNINVNRAGATVRPLCGDVREIAPRLLKGQCDRILMPLPKGAEDFLDTAFECSKKGCVIHFYSFSPEKDSFSAAIKNAEKAAKNAGLKIGIKNKKIVRPYAPRVNQIVLDIKVK